MMSREKPLQSQLYSTPRDLGARVPSDHLLRRVHAELDLSFSYEVVEQAYGAVGQASIPPPTVLKLMLLMALYDVGSERKLMRDLPMRIDWLWFLGYDLDTKIPNHSVLSKARRRWGTKVFQELFERSIALCISHGLIDGRDLLMDSSLIDANASVDSLFGAKAIAAAITSRLDDATPAEQSEEEPKGGADQADAAGESTEPAAKYRSSTDPDATGTKRRGEIKMRPRYQTHRAVDSKEGVITATTLGPGHENEATRLEELVNAHSENTNLRVEVLTADSKYGTADNLEFCEWNHITAYIPPFRDAYARPREGKFTECCFRYDAEKDHYVCPAGQILRRGEYRPEKEAYRYRARASACDACPVRTLCTTSKTGRTILRLTRRDVLDRALARVKTESGRAHRTRRRWMMEGSFAHSSRLGYKRTHVRGIESVTGQNFLIAAVQNVLILLWNTARKAASSCLTATFAAQIISACHRVLSAMTGVVRNAQALMASHRYGKSYLCPVVSAACL